MYIRTSCSNCKKIEYHNVKIDAIETMVFNDYEKASSYIIKNINVCDSVSEEELAERVLKEIKPMLQDGTNIIELCRIIQSCFGVASTYCCDLIQRIKLEAGMYSPDKAHLYYA
ncbi:MAG: hypothetical protein IBX39_09515 [Candidatus Methanoperedenaceae archaeon]|nr:hypothetical protein [Candidatus Methanoperedenaceae archaeon]